MKSLTATSLLIMLFSAAAISAIETDFDHDGIPDSLDRRPHVASYYHHGGLARQNPADQPIGQDTDNDGIADRLDARPWVASYYHHGGLPKHDPAQQQEELDTDSDGVPDRLDNRPSVAEYYHAAASETPVVIEPAPVKDVDSDGDGVPDSQDKCPNTPAGAKVDASGCTLDSDNDGVPDHLDKCPNTPKGIPVDSVGCPKLVRKGEKITLEIEYATNSYEPDAKSKEILNGIAQTMKDFPEIKVAVKGFTDNVGSETYNKKLSENRAKGVLDYLAGRGVERRRMSAKGFGENPDYFVGDNNTETGRQKNRRVEIESVD